MRATEIEMRDTTTTKEVVVSASRSPMLYENTGRSIQMISSEKIKAYAASNIETILKNHSSVDLRQRGASGAQADLSIRGGSFDQTLVLLNGIKMTDLQTGHHNLNLPIDLESIDRIEVIEGGASRVLGPNAFSGAVNFITDGKRDLSAAARISSGTNNYLNFGLNTNIPISDANFYVSFSKSKSDGYIKNTDFSLINFYSVLNYSSAYGSISLDLGYNNKEFGSNSFYTPVYPDQFEETSTRFAAIRYNAGHEIFGDNFGFSFNMHFREHNDRFELFRSSINAASWYKGHNYHQTCTYGYEAKFSWINSFGTTSAGFDYRNENILSNVLGTQLLESDYIDVPNEDGAKFDKAGFRNSSNAFLEHNTKIGILSISGGLLYNFTTAYDSKIYPGIDFAVKLSENASVFTSYNKSLRFPTFTELYYNTSTHSGDINLLPEESDSYEIGIKFRNDKASLQASVFHRFGSNMIDWVKELKDGLPVDNSKFKSMNIATINATGLEISAGLNLQQAFSFQSILNSINISYSYLSMKAADVNPNFLSTYALDNLKHKLTASMQFVLPLEINMNWDVCYEIRNGQYLKYEDKKAIGLSDYEPHVLFNAKISKSIYDFNISLEAYNLLNINYFDLGNLPQPGREIRIIFGYQFGE